jgi:hypothetical protein
VVEEAGGRFLNGETTMNSTTIVKPKSKRLRKFAREPRSEPAGTNAPSNATANYPASPAQPEAKPKSKMSLLLDLVTRPVGATLEQMVAATGWLPHTTRAALTGLKKKGHAIISIKPDGVRTYRLATADAGQGDSPAETEAKVDA